MSPAGSDAERTTASTEPSVRRATTDDVGALIDLDLASARHHAALDPGLYRVPDRAAVAAFLRRRLADPDREVLVAEVDGAVVGAVDVTLAEEPDPGSIVAPMATADLGISVLETWRGRGIGHLLMAAAEATARSRGAERIILDMSAANVDALRFYRSLGFRDHELVLRRDFTDAEGV